MMQVASRRRGLIGALAETVLDRALTPLKHTAIDLALQDAVRSAEVPILPMVANRIPAPHPEDDEDGRLAEDGWLVGHARYSDSWLATSRDCSTGPPPSGSTRARQWCRPTYPGLRRTARISVLMTRSSGDLDTTGRMTSHCLEFTDGEP
ncbi:hypothetical protein ACOACO_14105 [Nocardioides sp. CPCC 205120]|uniref:hypothetical protein n=1 Tax=Nocardioides sp. CPCC 205120 TaxID=3406462 RepID=UPI003B503AFA